MRLPPCVVAAQVDDHWLPIHFSQAHLPLAYSTLVFGEVRRIHQPTCESVGHHETGIGSGQFAHSVPVTRSTILGAPSSSLMMSFIVPSRTSVMLSPLRRAFGRWLLQPRTPGPTSGQARPRRRSCRASSTICTTESVDSLPESPPTPPDARARSYQDSSRCSPSPRRRGC